MSVVLTGNASVERAIIVSSPAGPWGSVIGALSRQATQAKGVRAAGASASPRARGHSRRREICVLCADVAEKRRACAGARGCALRARRLTEMRILYAQSTCAEEVVIIDVERVVGGDRERPGGSG